MSRDFNPFDDDYQDDNFQDRPVGDSQDPPIDTTASFNRGDELGQNYTKTRQGRSAPLLFSNPFVDQVGSDSGLGLGPTATEKYLEDSFDRAPILSPDAIASSPSYKSPKRNYNEAGTIAHSEMSPLLPDDLSRGYQSSSPSLRSGRSRRRKITVPSRIFTGHTSEPSPYAHRRRLSLSSAESRRSGNFKRHRGGHQKSDVVMNELAHSDDHEHPEQVQMEYKYILLEDLGTAASWVILVLPYATFFFSILLLYLISVPVAAMGSTVTALRISCFLVTFSFIVFWIRKMEMVQLCIGGFCKRLRCLYSLVCRNLFRDDEKGDEIDGNTDETYWWENPWVLFPERYYVLPLLVSSLLVLEPILVVIYFYPALGTPTLYSIAHASSEVGIQACAFIYLCLIQGFRYHTGERSKRRAELQRKALQLRRAVKFVDECKDEHKSFIDSPKVVQNYYDEFGDIDGSAFTGHLRLPNDPCADGWADFLLPKTFLLAIGVLSASMVSFSMAPPGGDKGFRTLFVFGSIIYAMTLSAWTLLTIAALYTTGQKLKREPFLGTRPAQLAYRILFAHSGLAIIGLCIASMQYINQIKMALKNETISTIIEQENRSVVYLEDISFPEDFDDDKNELTELQILSKKRRDKRLVVHLAKESKTWRIFPCPIQNLDESNSLFQDDMFQLYKDFHTDRDTHQRGLVSIGPYTPVFCAELACWLNEASWQAYNSPVESTERKDFGNIFDKEDFVGWMRLDLIGLQLEGYVYDERTSTQAYIATNSAPQVDGEEDSIIVVAFRGTSDVANVKTDFRFRQVPLHDQITGIGESSFRVFPDRVEISDADGWIWDTKTTKKNNDGEYVKCVDCWTEAAPPCTPTHTASTPKAGGRNRTYSVGGFDGVVSKDTVDILKGAPLARNSFPMVHEGFQDAYSEIRQQLFELLLPVLQRQLAKSTESSTRAAGKEPLALPKIYCTGHSLGGSLAQLFALDLAANCELVLPHRQSQSRSSPSPTQNKLREQAGFFPTLTAVTGLPPKDLRLQPAVGVYTYGQPRVGNKAFSRLYKQRVPHSFRVVNEGDAITTIPNYLWCGGLYKHAGLEVILDAGMTGNVLVGPTVVETLFRFHKVRTNVMAHQMQRYRECLECIFDPSELLEYYRDHNVAYEELRDVSGGNDEKRKQEERRQTKENRPMDGLDWNLDSHRKETGVVETDELNWYS
ncbi:unnamed protein product [Pseudo-nitzschia multistriata]|uniref:Fungal lipase-type domain-containing protein n=1 Tax=Pseudo-nitzschia multistriata TaxID=183589 RepID=A0A448ZD21_9STRA|nr:unnamed protein product [Pseudo-nitzschia multistriata]